MSEVDRKSEGERGEEDLLWQALADATRRRILDLLRKGPATTGELAEILAVERGLSRFAAMKHLGILVRAGLVSIRREGRFRWNYLNAAPFVAMYHRWVSNLAAHSGELYFDLKAYAERGDPGASPSDGSSPASTDPSAEPTDTPPQPGGKESV